MGIVNLYSMRNANVHLFTSIRFINERSEIDDKSSLIMTPNKIVFKLHRIHVTGLGEGWFGLDAGVHS